MADMTVKVILDLVDKFSQKKGKSERSMKDLKRSADRLKGDNSGLAGSEDKLAKAADRVARAEKSKATALGAASKAARKHKDDLASLEKQEDRLAKKAAKIQGKNGGKGRGANAANGWDSAKSFGGAAAGGLGLGVAGGLATAGGAAIGTAIGSAVLGAGSDEFAKDQLQVLANMTDAQFAQYDAYLKTVGKRRGTGTQGAYGVFGEMMMGGMDAGSAQKMTEPIILFAKATQAAEEDAAKTAMALANNLKIAPDQMMQAFDAMATGAKEGQFEVRDMAKSFPSLAAKMAAVGGTGLDAMKNIVSMAEIVRSVSGTSDEAATNLENFFDKLTSSDFVDNAKALGINVEKSFAQANGKGLNPALELVKEIKAKVGDNAFKLGELVPDRQARVALMALIKQVDEWEAKNKRAGDSAGTVMNDYTKATDNASAAWDRFSANVSGKAKSIAEKVLPAVTSAMNSLSQAMETGGDGSAQSMPVPDGATPETQQAIASANDRGARINRFFETLFGSEPSQSTKDVNIKDGYAQYGRIRNAPDVSTAKMSRAERAKKIGGILGPNIEDIASGNGMKMTTDKMLAGMDAAGAEAGKQYATGFQKGLDGVIPIPTPRPDRSIPIPTPRPANPAQMVTDRIAATGPGVGGADGSAELSKIYQGFLSGGQKAADTVSNGADAAGARLGSSANERISGGAAAAGATFGRAAAAEIRAATANIKVNVSAPSGQASALPRAKTGALHGGME